MKRPDVTKRNLENNPMKRKEIRDKVSEKLKGKTAWNKGKKLGFTPKEAFKKGDAPWNRGLNKENTPQLSEMDFQKGHNSFEGTEKTQFKPNDERLVGENNPNWKGGYEPYYGPNWRQQRRFARERDNFICQLCGSEENGRKHDVHHIIPFRELTDYEVANELENLLTLCSSCHRKVNWHPELLERENGHHI